jgi:hypothetical protein
MAKTDRLHRWLALGANIGILIGLVLVIVQIRQSTQLARATYRSQGSDVANQIWASLMGGHAGDVIEKSVECPKELTYSDFMALDAFLFTAINILYRDYQLAQEGLYSETDWHGTVDAYANWYLANPFARGWWDEEGKNFFPEEFATYVSRQLRETSGRDSHAHWLAIRARVTGEAPIGRPGICRSREETPSDPRAG